MSIEQLKAGECCGCYACKTACPTQCITMVEDEEGFWYPKIDVQKCIRCELCEQVCPEWQTSVKDDQGKRLAAYAAVNQNEEVRLQSSSGGVFTLMAEETLNSGGLVFGAAMTEDCRAVEHIAVEQIEDLERLRGSKYLQSRIGDSYQLAKKCLQDGKKVLFSGTPCQIEGLRSYLQRDYDNLLCVDIICHGVPSPKVWDRYVSFKETQIGAPVRKVCFRNKKFGWKTFALSLHYTNGAAYEEKLSEDLFMQAFLRDVCLRPSCSQCSFKKLNRLSDITLADFWGVETVMPEMDDDKGTSLVLVHSSKGEQVFERIQKNLRVKVVAVADAIRHNSAAISSVVQHERRSEFFSHLDSMPFDKLVRRYTAPKLSVKERIGVMLQKMGLLSFVQRIRRRT